MVRVEGMPSYELVQRGRWTNPNMAIWSEVEQRMRLAWSIDW